MTGIFAEFKIYAVTQFNLIRNDNEPTMQQYKTLSQSLHAKVRKTRKITSQMILDHYPSTKTKLQRTILIIWAQK
jgi:hypothetical protein